MIKNTVTFLVGIFFMSTMSSCQANLKFTNNGYSINSNLKDSIEKKVKTDQGQTGSTIYIRMFSLDSSFLDTYSLGSKLDGTFITASSLLGDTITTIGFFGTIYYKAKITRNSCQVTCVVSTDEKLYKIKKDDKLTDLIYLPCDKYNLTLINTPSFKKGELLEGIVNLSTEEFIQKINNKEVKLRMHMTGYFKTILSENNLGL